MAKDKPYYPHNPIATIEALAKHLGVIPGLLRDLSKDISKSYVTFQIISKKGKIREVHEPKYELKRVQKRINSKLFESVEFPSYLQGGIKDPNNPRDYVENSKKHAGSKFLITLDVKDFYPSIKESWVLPIFRNLFNFPDDVALTLTNLVTLNGKLPQGACTSSYIANLIFFNTEYSLVSKLRGKGFNYSRLLDDITISSNSLITQEVATDLIKETAAMIRKYNLRINSSKTKIERADDLKADYSVTGLWVGHGIPKIRKKDRHHVRHLVYICEKEHEKSPYSQDYHNLWNRVSGQVATLQSLQHSQSKSLRSRLANILPLYDDQAKSNIIHEAKKLLKKPKHTHTKVGVIKSYNRIIYSLGILSRTDRPTSKALRRQLTEKFSGIPSKSEIWS